MAVLRDGSSPADALAEAQRLRNDHAAPLVVHGRAVAHNKRASFITKLAARIAPRAVDDVDPTPNDRAYAKLDVVQQSLEDMGDSGIPVTLFCLWFLLFVAHTINCLVSLDQTNYYS
jgi:hypothetical protein